MSVFNGILRKPHQPRELEIQCLIKDLNLKLPPKPSCDDLEDGDYVEENPESEEEATDDECHLSHLLFICATNVFQCRSVFCLRKRVMSSQLPSRSPGMEDLDAKVAKSAEPEVWIPIQQVFVLGSRGRNLPHFG